MALRMVLGRNIFDFTAMFYGLFVKLTPLYEKRLTEGQKMRTKAGGELVGDLDDEMDREISGFLSETFPGIPIISEEKESRWPPRAKRFFLVDPLDGTHNSAIETPMFGSMLALVDRGDVTMSAIYLPFQPHPARLYMAMRGEGARRFPLNGMSERIRVSETTNLKKAFLFLEGQTQNNFSEANIGFTLGAIRAGKRMRSGFSSCWTGTRVASGGMLPTSGDVLIARNNKPMDNLPIALLVEEAGGMVTDHEGKPWSLTNCSSLIFSNGHLHEQVLALNKPRSDSDYLITPESPQTELALS